MMTEQTLANILRATNVLLALLYLPLLFARLRDRTSDVPIMTATVFVLFSVILGSWENRHSPFRFAILLMTVALVIHVFTSVNRYRKQREVEKVRAALAALPADTPPPRKNRPRPR